MDLDSRSEEADFARLKFRWTMLHPMLLVTRELFIRESLYSFLFFFFFFRTRFSIRPVDRELKHLRAIIIRRNDETRRKGNENFAHKSYALGGALNGCIKGGWRKKVCCAKFA